MRLRVKYFVKRVLKALMTGHLDSNMILEKIHLNELKNTLFNQASSFPETGILSGKGHLLGPILRPQLLRAEGKMEILDAAIRYQGTNVHFTAINGTGRWIKDGLAHDLKMKIFGGNIQIKGHMKLNKTAKDEWDPVIDSDVISQSIRLADLRPLIQKDWFPRQGTLAGKVHVQGPVLSPEAMKGKGQLKVLNFEVKMRDALVPIPVTEFEGTWANSRLAHDLKMKVFGGNIQIKGHMKLNKTAKDEWDPVIDSDVISQSIRLADLRPLIQKDWFPRQGTLAGKVHVQGPVLSPEAMKGKGQLKVLNFEVKMRDALVPIPVTEFEGTWANSRLAHDLKMKVFGGNIQIKGHMKLNKTAKDEWDPVIDSDVISQSIRLADLRPLIQKDWFPRQGTLAGKVHVQGPVLSPEAITAQGKLRAQNIAIQLEGRNINLADIEGKGVWSDNHLSHRIQIKGFGGSVSVQGNLNFKKNNQDEWDPVIDSDVISQSIRLADLRPLIQKDWFPRQGTLAGKVHVQGPVKGFSKIELKGTLAGKKVLLKIKEKSVAFEKTVLSFEPNTQKNMQIGFNLDNISIGELKLKKSAGKMVFLKESFELKQGKIWSKTGVLFLNGAYKFEAKGYKLDISGKGLRLEDFKDKYLEGPLSLKGILYGRVLSEGFMKGLSGNFEINSENGKVLKTDGITSKILSALSLSFSPGADKGFPFDSLGGGFHNKKRYFIYGEFRND